MTKLTAEPGLLSCCPHTCVRGARCSSISEFGLQLRKPVVRRAGSSLPSVVNRASAVEHLRRQAQDDRATVAIAIACAARGSGVPQQAAIIVANSYRACA